MNSGNFSSRGAERIRQAAIRNASHGDFFFAKWVASDGYERKSPCFVISDDGDPLEIIVLKVTTKPARTAFDVPVELRKPSFVRTNKIYTVQRSQLLFPITKQLTSDEYDTIIDKLKEAIKVDQ